MTIKIWWIIKIFSNDNFYDFFNLNADWKLKNIYFWSFDAYIKKYLIAKLFKLFDSN